MYVMFNAAVESGLYYNKEQVECGLVTMEGSGSNLSTSNRFTKQAWQEHTCACCSPVADKDRCNDIHPYVWHVSHK